MKKFIYLSKILSLALVICLFVTSCGNNAETVSHGTGSREVNSQGADSKETSSQVSDSQSISASELFSNRDLSWEYDEAECEKVELADNNSTSDSKGVEIDGNVVTITKEGIYILSGTLSDGMIIVDTDKTQKVQLVLNGVNINSADSAAIYVKKADKVFITLADGSENTLSNGGNFTAIDDNNIDAVIFSKDDLTLNGKGSYNIALSADNSFSKDDLAIEGTGSLTISSPAGHGIVSKDELVITGGAYYISALSHGISGKDIVAIADGYFEIDAGEDAIHSVNNDDYSVGNIYIGDGVYDLKAKSDGISAMNEVCIEGGSIIIADSYEGIEGRIINISDGVISLNASDDGINATDKRENTDNNTDGMQGGMMGDVQSDASINISGGVTMVNAEGDALDSNGYIIVTGGEVYVAGSSGGQDGALDYGIDASISGGIVVAAGQSNMAQNFGSNSTQGSILVNTNTQNVAGSDIVLLDKDGNTLVEWTMGKSYNSVVVSCKEIADKESYTLMTGDTKTEVTMDGLIYGGGFGTPGGMGGRGGFGGHGGMGGFNGGERPEGFEGFDGAEPPEGFEGFDGAEPPEGFKEFDGTEPPEGFEGFDGTEPPEGFEGFNASEHPHGMDGHGHEDSPDLRNDNSSQNGRTE
ncbi:MAG: carbohydrate-binding domain-containing protein [Butyrivibrio sp.]|nr:carbohydrate-binding domain-containing protein [Butyrivibrio sp.]